MAWLAWARWGSLFSSLLAAGCGPASQAMMPVPVEQGYRLVAVADSQRFLVFHTEDGTLAGQLWARPLPLGEAVLLGLGREASTVGDTVLTDEAALWRPGMTEPWAIAAGSPVGVASDGSSVLFKGPHGVADWTDGALVYVRTASCVAETCAATTLVPQGNHLDRGLATRDGTRVLAWAGSARTEALLLDGKSSLIASIVDGPGHAFWSPPTLSPGEARFQITWQDETGAEALHVYGLDGAEQWSWVPPPSFGELRVVGWLDDDSLLVTAWLGAPVTRSALFRVQKGSAVPLDDLVGQVGWWLAGPRFVVRLSAQATKGASSLAAMDLSVPGAPPVALGRGELLHPVVGPRGDTLVVFDGFSSDGRSGTARLVSLSTGSVLASQSGVPLSSDPITLRSVAVLGQPDALVALEMADAPLGLGRLHLLRGGEDHVLSERAINFVAVGGPDRVWVTEVVRYGTTEIGMVPLP